MLRGGVIFALEAQNFSKHFHFEELDGKDQSKTRMQMFRVNGPFSVKRTSSAALAPFPTTPHKKLWLHPKKSKDLFTPSESSNESERDRRRSEEDQITNSKYQ